MKMAKKLHIKWQGKKKDYVERIQIEPVRFEIYTIDTHQYQHNL